ncbi:RdgB/HAM1 family non-canonical purine NTP pyrophosphatase [Bacteriovorax sp. Seq25_V]|uniref:RdgB/HAM1 family non-canonical purine NTP pyrophosphatase n=1 Tax=Bacteriovorax sp. Seq25_V TaxID=1201288 RepID=UPI00038A0F4E|nr:RdgB/HAM1 family non-canonical purine NTP pyrophosphatase [Bacteriovorax sp. Seq25_V]EQC46923.1 non-canonical purine NTP pyrophosphatase, RdgB/HAM1 family [Bacteriovorax sp. Seq25_V]
MNKFVLATGNAHKAEEFAKIFNPEVLEISAAPEKLEVVEDGVTFHENALKKAKAYYDKFKTPILSDDSGICVAALPNELGIHSARFGGDGLTDKDRAMLLLEKMQDEKNREAYFVCVLCFYIDENNIYFFEGRMEGQISDTYTGEHGFGYDPVFKPLAHESDKTIAELAEWKDDNSHRAKACKQAEIFFRERNCQNGKDKL